MTMPWFRLYSEFASDPKIQLLAFEDQRHFIVLLCLRCNETLTTSAANPAHFERLIAKALGLDPATAIEVKRRLIEVGLIDDLWHPVAWEKRQYSSDTSTERTRKWREKQRETSQERHKNVTVTDKNRTDTDKKETEKRFAPPSIDEVKEFFESKGYPLEAEKFFNFYSSKGWMVGKNKMVSWKSSASGWLSRDRGSLQKIDKSLPAELRNAKWM